MISVTKFSNTLLLGSILLFTACMANVGDDTAFRAQAEAYIRSNIGALSPEDAQVGGDFYVTSIDWVDDDTATVSYEDGHVAFRGTTDVSLDEFNEIVASQIRVETNVDSSSSASTSSMSSEESSSSTFMTSSSTSVSARAKASVGQFCGGIAGIMCDTGLTCEYEGTYPDAGGTCVEM